MSDHVRRLARQVHDDIHRLEDAVQRLAERVDMPYYELWGGIVEDEEDGDE